MRTFFVLALVMSFTVVAEARVKENIKQKAVSSSSPKDVKGNPAKPVKK